MTKVAPRSVSPIIATIRDFFLGRKSQEHNRFADYIANRTQPPPNLPGGSADKLADNYYCIRDARREAGPPIILAVNSRAKQLTSSSAVSAGRPATERLPGKPYLV